MRSALPEKGWAAGRRPPGLCSRRGGLVQPECTPHFSFVVPKEKRAVHGPKRKALGALRCSGPPRDGGRRIGACSDFAWPSGTLFSSAKSALPSRGGWCVLGRGARTHLTSSSFTVSRCGAPSISVTSVPLVPPSARSASLCAARASVGAVALVLCCNSHRPPASGSEKRSWMYPRPPRAKGLPKGRAFPSLTAARDRQPSPAGGRRSALAQTDPPNIFSFPPGAAQKVNCPAGAREAPLEGFLFDVSMRGPHRAPRGGERRSKGAGAVFAAGGNGAERTLRRRQWGAHPAWTMPPGGSQSPRAVDDRPYTSAGSVSGIERETSPERSQSYPSCRIRSSSKAPAPII